MFQDTVITPSGAQRDVSEYWGTKLLRTAYRAVELMPEGEIDKGRMLKYFPPLDNGMRF